MMKYYIDTNNVIFAYPDDGSQDELIGDKRELSYDEAMAIANPAPTPEQQIKMAESERQRLLNTAQQRITVWQTKLLMGRKLTESESLQLNTWMDYIDAVTAVDTSKLPSVEWPTVPE